jgi:hypothetical protein
MITTIQEHLCTPPEMIVISLIIHELECLADDFTFRRKGQHDSYAMDHTIVKQLGVLVIQRKLGLKYMLTTQKLNNFKT